MTSFRVRAATDDDVTFLGRMLYEAATWRADSPRPSRSDVLNRAEIAVYLGGWGRTGDTATVAEDDGGRPLGAAWYRLFSEAEHGFGFVSAEIPEISIGVERDARGRGVGTSLLDALIERAKAQRVGALSLSVEHDNPAVRLYERAGFHILGRAGGALTMLRDVV
jgi:ribosomal protein S18 acetylase RimI-like enzyme